MTPKTSKIGTAVEAGAKRFITERGKIWEKYDEAMEQEARLEKFALEFGSASAKQDMPSLSNSQEPPDEVAAVVWKLQQESEDIKRMKAKIEAYQKSIEETKQQFFIALGIAVFVVFVLFLIIISSFS